MYMYMLSHTSWDLHVSVIHMYNVHVRVESHFCHKWDLHVSVIHMYIHIHVRVESHFCHKWDLHVSVIHMYIHIHVRVESHFCHKWGHTCSWLLYLLTVVHSLICKN